MQSLRLHAPREWQDESQFPFGQFGLMGLNGYETGRPPAALEMNRLFSFPPNEDEPEMEQIGIKMALIYPLMGRRNAPKLVLSPTGSIAGTYALRMAVKQFRNLLPIPVKQGSCALDLHVHTMFSHDSVADVRQMLSAAARRGLSGIAITDHNTIDGVRAARTAAAHMIRAGQLPPDFLIIDGEEISSSDGHVIGLFLTGEIPPGMSAARTVGAIHEQGGVAVAAHPELPDGVGALAGTLPFDAVESKNAAEEVHFAFKREGGQDLRAAFYGSIHKPLLGDSDAHDPGVVGMCYTVLPCGAAPGAVKAALLRGETSPVERITGKQIAEEADRGFLRKAYLVGKSLKPPSLGIGRWLRRSTGADGAHVGIWPRPSLVWYKRF